MQDQVRAFENLQREQEDKFPSLAQEQRPSFSGKRGSGNHRNATSIDEAAPAVFSTFAAGGVAVVSTPWGDLRSGRVKNNTQDFDRTTETWADAQDFDRTTETWAMDLDGDACTTTTTTAAAAARGDDLSSGRAKTDTQDFDRTAETWPLDNDTREFKRMTETWAVDVSEEARDVGGDGGYDDDSAVFNGTLVNRMVSEVRRGSLMSAARRDSKRGSCGPSLTDVAGTDIGGFVSRGILDFHRENDHPDPVSTAITMTADNDSVKSDLPEEKVACLEDRRDADGRRSTDAGGERNASGGGSGIKNERGWEKGKIEEEEAQAEQDVQRVGDSEDERDDGQGYHDEQEEEEEGKGKAEQEEERVEDSEEEEEEEEEERKSSAVSHPVADRPRRDSRRIRDSNAHVVVWTDLDRDSRENGADNSSDSNHFPVSHDCDQSSADLEDVGFVDCGGSNVESSVYTRSVRHPDDSHPDVADCLTSGRSNNTPSCVQAENQGVAGLAVACANDADANIDADSDADAGQAVGPERFFRSISALGIGRDAKQMDAPEIGYPVASEIKGREEYSGGGKKRGQGKRDDETSASGEKGEQSERGEGKPAWGQEEAERGVVNEAGLRLATAEGERPTRAGCPDDDEEEEKEVHPRLARSPGTRAFGMEGGVCPPPPLVTKGNGFERVPTGDMPSADASRRHVYLFSGGGGLDPTEHEEGTEGNTYGGGRREANDCDDDDEKDRHGALLTGGGYFLMHGRFGKPQMRFVWVSSDLGTIMWR